MKSLFSKRRRANQTKLSEEPFDSVSPQNEKYFSGDLHKDIIRIKQLYTFPINIDFMIREFTLYRLDKRAALFYIPSIADTKVIDEEILKPLMMSIQMHQDITSSITVSAIREEQDFQKAMLDLNTGDTLLLIEGQAQSYVIRTGDVAGRNVDKPQNETTLFGPKESFVEKVELNISLIRKKIRSEHFTVEKKIIGQRSHNEVYIIYNKELAGEKVLGIIKQRLEAISKDSVQNISLLAQYIEDRKRSLMPTILQTERPDRAASFIEDGYVVMLMNNSPYALIAPATFWSFFHSADDHYLRFFFGNFTRIIRMFALFITLLVPSIYIAVTNYHVEMLPPDLLLAIAGAREMVPLPAILELLMLELAFELIREAGIRVPTPIGPTIGIVGALILGQAAVEANIASPIVVIVVALTGLSSFAIQDLNLNYAIRLTRFGFLIAAGYMGLFGIICCYVACLAYVASIKSFGVPYLAPFTPKYTSSGDTLLRKVLKNEKLRPSFTKTKELTKDTGQNKGN